MNIVDGVNLKQTKGENMKMFMKVSSVVSLGLLLTSLLNAAEVDLKASKLVWSAEKKVSSGHTGELPLISAKAVIEKDNIKSGEFVVDMQNFTVTDLEGEYQKKFLNHVRSGDFFEADKYKTAKLVIKEQVGSKVKADLTIKDKTNPVEIEFKKEGKTYKGDLVFDRTKFGVTYGSGTFFKALGVDKIIKDEVKVAFTIVTK